MKICPNCRNTVEDNAIFCDKCGARLAAPNNAQGNYPPPPNNQMNYTQQPPYNYGVNQPPYPQTVPQNPPKKKNTGMIIGIVAAVLIVLAIIGFVAQEMLQKQGYGDNDNSSYTYGNNSSYTHGADNPTSNSKKKYSKGSVVNGRYVNEWANLRFDISGNWTNGSAEEYGSYEGDFKTQCGLYLNDTANGRQLSICFEKLIGVNASITEEAYLNIVTDGLKQQYTEAGLTCTVSAYKDTTIAGETFKTATVTFEEISLVQAIHVRNYDGYMIFMAVMAQSDSDASRIAGTIQTAD